MKDINWNDMPEWADSVGEVGHHLHLKIWMNDTQYCYVDSISKEVFEFNEEDNVVWSLSEVRNQTYPPKQSEETVDETTSIRVILEETFNKVYEQHGVRLERVGFEYSKNLVGSVELMNVDVEGRM